MKVSSSKRLTAVFYKSSSGKEPVRVFINELSKEDKIIVGTDILKVEIGWPIGMPVCKNIGKGIFEVRSTISHKREVRVLFSIVNNQMFLLNAFIKKTQTTPKKELELAVTRLYEVLNG